MIRSLRGYLRVFFEIEFINFLGLEEKGLEYVFCY